MNTLRHWQDKIKEKRKQTSFQEYMRTFLSWSPTGFYRNGDFISIYPSNTGRVSIQKRQDFDASRDDVIKTGRDYDFSKTFFENFQSLLLDVKLPNLYHVGNNENCDFVDTAVNSKDSYLSFIVAWDCSDVQYSFMVRENSTNVLNSSYVVTNNSSVYSSSAVTNSMNIFYSRYISNSNNIWFSSNLVGCRECLFCEWLENVSYAIENKTYPKEEYFEKKKKLLNQKEKFDMYFTKVSKIWAIHASKNCSGSSIMASENIQNGYFVNNMMNGRNVMFAGSESDGGNCYDVFAGWKWTKDCYGVVNFWWMPENIYCSYNIGFGSDIYYSMFLDDCSFCFGCVGLLNKQYCIFNKQYTKEQWYKKIDQIFMQMEEEGMLGEYFSAELNPFYFNDTFAQLFGRFQKGEVIKNGFLWRDEPIKVDIPAGVEIVSFEDVSTYQWYNSKGVWNIDKTILQKAIKDSEGNYYKITSSEYDFLVKHELPIPTNHYLKRLQSLF